MKSEPYEMTCPRCGKKMEWNPRQGPGTGGWKCLDAKCGLKVDHKG